MSIRHRASVAVATLATVLLVGVGFAWACTSQAYISVTPDEAEAGTKVTVNGEQFMPQHEIAIRWGSRNGPELGRVRGPEFHMEVTVPESAEPGDYLVWAVDTEDNWAARRSFTVTDPNADSSGDGASGGASGGERTTESDTSGQTTASTSGGDGTSDDSGSGGSDQTAATTSGGSGDGQDDDSSSTASGDSQPNKAMSPQSGSDEPASQDGSSQDESASGDASQPSGDGSPQDEPSPPDSGSREPASQESASQDEPASQAGSSNSPEESAGGQPGNTADPSPKGSQAEPAADEPTADGDAASQQAEGAPTARADDADAPVSPQAPPTQPNSPGAIADGGTAQPSTATGSQDLWEGLDSSQQPGLSPSLEGPAAEGGELAGAGQQLAVAAGLLGAGLIMLAGGAFVAIRRRYALAASVRENSK